MKWRFWQREEGSERKQEFSVENPPEIREGANTYVRHGDNMWGNSITSFKVRDHEHSVSGWLARAPFPVTGDKLLMKQQGHGWVVFVFGEVETCRGVSDMFQGTVYGPFDMPVEREPQTKHCDEFFTNLSPYSRC